MLNPYIKTFLAVADIGSFSAAAEKLYLSRVSVKKQIDALESQLGTNLFVRTSQGTSLTDSGKVFYEHAVQLVVMSETAVCASFLVPKNPICSPSPKQTHNPHHFSGITFV